MDTETVKDEKSNLKDAVDDLTSHIRDYAETYYKITVLKIAEKATGAGASALVVVSLATLGFFGLIFASLGLAYWLGNLIESRVGGFLIVAGIYFLAMIVVIALRKKIIFPLIRNSIIRKIYE
jgi:hypothetical protein